ncbi:MAG TPA: hypothetical protein VNJ54_00370 [Plantibacter sp.]|uniref:hypothetical protein n=1 Tax=Plantibacter sp. TaxID=1871045 RepID=UPI002CC86DE2|nr:hypothetical protein [Plantibacter sp.]
MSYEQQLRFDVFVTALEGGIGYWSECEKYHWVMPTTTPTYDARHEEDIEGFHAIIRDVGEQDDTEKVYRIDQYTISRGLSLARGEWRDKLRWNCGGPPPIVVDEEGWDHDAWDADCIVQLGLFGEVPYG